MSTLLRALGPQFVLSCIQFVEEDRGKWRVASVDSVVDSAAAQQRGATKPSQLTAAANLLLVDFQCIAVLHIKLLGVSDVSSKSLAPHDISCQRR
jgi:hypothetical protein